MCTFSIIFICIYTIQLYSHEPPSCTEHTIDDELLPKEEDDGSTSPSVGAGDDDDKDGGDGMKGYYIEIWLNNTPFEHPVTHEATEEVQDGEASMTCIFSSSVRELDPLLHSSTSAMGEDKRCIMM